MGRAVDDLLSDFTSLAAAADESAATAPQASGADDSCQFAFDGVCDEPGIGTGACAVATDATDCGGA